MKTFKQFLIEDIRYNMAGFKHDEKTVNLNIAYHITSAQNLNSIQTKGLLPNKVNINEPNAVFMTESIYGAIILTRTLFKNKKIKDDYVLLQINTKDLKLFKDPFSIKESGVYTYDDIPPNKIKIISIIDYDIFKNNYNWIKFWNWWFWNKQPKPDFIKKFKLKQYR